MAHCILPPPPDRLTVQQMFCGLAERRLAAATTTAPVPDAESILQAESDAEDLILKQARRDRARRSEWHERAVSLVAAGWSFDEIDEAMGNQRRGLAARDVAKATEAATLPPVHRRG